MKNNIKIILFVLGAFLLGMAFYSIFFSNGDRVTATEEAMEEADEQTTWTCSMHPQIRQPEPGQCPICGMDLIPLETTDEGGDAGAVQMTETAVRLANIRTMEVGKSSPVKEIRLNGKVAPNERLVKTQSAHITGRIEELYVNTTGEYVRQGQKLADVYSPALITAQEELLQGYAIRENQPALFEAARQKLRRMQIGEEQIEQIVESREILENISIYADRSGIVLDKMVNVGDYLNKGDALYTIVNLYRVWVLFDAYESDLPWIETGDEIEFTVASLPNQLFVGKVTFIDPIVNPRTRVASVRVETSNPGLKLKPEMFATGLVEAEIAGNEERLVIPKSAVMWTGDRSIVYVSDPSAGTPQFSLREIALGPALENAYIVEDGLQAGERIVVNGTFTVDAAAQLAGKPSMMDPHAGEVPLSIQTAAESAPAMHDHQRLDIPDKSRLQIYDALTTYLEMKDELVSSRLPSTKEKAAELLEKLKAVDSAPMSEEAGEWWRGKSGELIKMVNEIKNAGQIEQARATFKPLSNLIIELAHVFGPFDQTIYVQHCPMADDFAGANWLSTSDQIRNPYFGDRMLKCGSVTDSIE